MDDETHRYIDKSVEVVSAQNDTRFTKASSEVKDVQAEMSVTKTELGAKVDGVEAQVGSLRTEMTAKVDSSKTELTAKIDGVEAQVGSSKTELTAKIDGVEAKLDSSITKLTAKVDGVEAKLDSSITKLTAKVDGVIDRLDGQNPLTAWQIVGIVIGAIFGGTTMLAGILFGFLSISGITLAAPDNNREIVELLEILIAQNEAASSQGSTPEIAPGIQGPDEGGSNSLPSEE